MKKYYNFMRKQMVVFLVISLLFLASCRTIEDSEISSTGTGNSSTPISDTSTTITTSTTSTTETTETTQTTTTATTVSTRNPEFVAMEEVFTFNSDNLYNHALSSFYESPKYINLHQFFGTTYEGRMEPTDAEWELLKEQPYFNINYDLHRISSATMNELLQKYFGISLADMDASAFSGLVYLESTDCYYHMATGIVGVVDDLEVTGLEEQPDGTIKMFYSALFREDAVAVLKVVDGGYQIVSNLPV